MEEFFDVIQLQFYYKLPVLTGDFGYFLENFFYMDQKQITRSIFFEIILKA